MHVRIRATSEGQTVKISSIATFFGGELLKFLTELVSVFLINPLELLIELTSRLLLL